MASRRYVFTLNNPSAQLDFTQHPIIRFAVWQLELAPNTGTPHYQGYLELERAVRITALKKIDCIAGAHFEVARGHRDTAAAYCRKEESRAPGDDSGPWEHGDWGAGGQGARTDIAAAVDSLTEGGIAAVVADHPVQYVKYHRGLEALAKKLKKTPTDDDFVPRPWQARLLKLLVDSPSDDRTIIWLTDTSGNIGKSRLVTKLIKSHGAIELSGRVTDMQYAYDSQPIVCFDICRTQAENIKHLYSFAEQLKNGRYLSTKYESEMKVFDPPHVLFVANITWDRDAWTNDRVKEFDSASPGFFDPEPEIID